MAQRVNYAQQSPALYKKFSEFNLAIKEGSIEESIRDLVAIRASQINGCAFCLDMHVKQAKLHGERELRLYHLPTWRESTLFVPRERAALAWTEVLTKIPEQGVPDDIYERVRTQLVREGDLGPDVPGDGDQRVEPHQCRLPHRAGLGGRRARAGQGQAGRLVGAV